AQFGRDILKALRKIFSLEGKERPAPRFIGKALKKFVRLGSGEAEESARVRADRENGDIGPLSHLERRSYRFQAQVVIAVGNQNDQLATRFRFQLFLTRQINGIQHLGSTARPYLSDCFR